jgi:hypothetical protein
MAGVDTLSTGLNTAVESLSVTLDNFDTISTELRDADLAGTVEGLRRLLENLSDPGLYDAVTGIISRADTLIQMISENPKKYLRITVF